MTKTGIDPKYSTCTVEWFENSIPMRCSFAMDTAEYIAMLDTIAVQYEDEFIGGHWLDSFLASPILDANYERTDIADVVAKQQHLNSEQKTDLLNLLRKHQKLFMGHLGCTHINNST